MEKNMMLNVESANGMDMPNVKEVCGSLSAYIINYCCPVNLFHI